MSTRQDGETAYTPSAMLKLKKGGKMSLKDFKGTFFKAKMWFELYAFNAIFLITCLRTNYCKVVDAICVLAGITVNVKCLTTLSLHQGRGKH